MQQPYAGLAMDLDGLRAAARIVYQYMAPTPQHRWPLLEKRLNCSQVWVKHENATPIGAFKLRGGLTYMYWLRQNFPEVQRVVTASRGNHGQSIATAAKAAGLEAVVYVPPGNSTSKNAAMRAQGARVLEGGHDVQACMDDARQAAESDPTLHFIDTFHWRLVAGVASAALELYEAVEATGSKLDRLYVSIGLGSGIAGAILAKQALGLDTEIIGVVSENADAYARSFEAAGQLIPTDSAQTIADGIAVRKPHPEALSLICQHTARVVRVSDEAVLKAMGIYFADTHHIAEGAAAANLAAALQDALKPSDEDGQLPESARIGLMLSGGNVDAPLYQQALATLGS